MLNLITLDKPCEVNGTLYKNPAEAYKALQNFDGDVVIRFNTKPATVTATEPPQQPKHGEFTGKLFRLKVRQYMTKPSSPGFDFQDKYNKGIPMPMRIMYGEVLEETRGMYKMKLHGRPEARGICMNCGKTLTHPISMLYGLGPECGGHTYINPFETKEELEAAMDEVRSKLAAVQWEGWVIKSAIEEWEQVEAD